LGQFLRCLHADLGARAYEIRAGIQSEGSFETANKAIGIRKRCVSKNIVEKRYEDGQLRGELTKQCMSAQEQNQPNWRRERYV
jgi:hypothetical protein